MDNGTGVVNDLHLAPSQTIPINCEYDPLKFNSSTIQIVQSKGDEAPGGHKWMT
jgi:hypothetical protein